MANIAYRSGDFTVATPVSGYRHESPLLPFSNLVVLFHQDFMQLQSYFVAQDYNTINPDIGTGSSTGYLINESPREDVGGNCVKWTRTWARVPATYDMPGGTYQFEFPSLNTVRTQTLVLPVAVTIRRTFFLCGNNGVASGGYAQWQDIPINSGFKVMKDGVPTDYVVSTITSPTVDEYLALVSAGTPIQIEDSKITPAFGSIFVRDDFFVKAK